MPSLRDHFEKFINAENTKQQANIVAEIRDGVTPTLFWLLLKSPKGYTEYKLKRLHPIVNDIIYMISTIDLKLYVLLKEFIVSLIRKIPQLTVSSLKLSKRVLDTYKLFHDKDRGPYIMLIIQSILQVIEVIKLILPQSSLYGIEWGLDHASQFKANTTTTRDVTTDTCILYIKIEHKYGETYPTVYLNSIEILQSSLDKMEEGFYADTQGGGGRNSITSDNIDDQQGADGRNSITSDNDVVPQGGGGKTSITSHEEVVAKGGGGQKKVTFCNEETPLIAEEDNKLVVNEETSNTTDVKSRSYQRRRRRKNQQ